MVELLEEAIDRVNDERSEKKDAEFRDSENLSKKENDSFLEADREEIKKANRRGLTYIGIVCGLATLTYLATELQGCYIG
jgi:hypothetical protein